MRRVSFLTQHLDRRMTMFSPIQQKLFKYLLMYNSSTLRLQNQLVTMRTKSW